DVGEARLEGVDDPVGIIDGEGGLAEVGGGLAFGAFDPGNFLGRLDEADALRSFAHRADDLIVALMDDEHDEVALAGETPGFRMDLGDERAGGVDDSEVADGGLVADGGGDTVGGEDEGRAVGDFGKRIDKGGAFVPEALDDML